MKNFALFFRFFPSSKIENSVTDARFETILKVFKALNAKINFNVELGKPTLAIR